MGVLHHGPGIQQQLPETGELEVAVGREPSGVALTPDGAQAYVANTVDGTVSVVKIEGNRTNIKVHKVLQVGTEPYGVAVTPNGRKVYVTNARSNNVSVIDARDNHLVTTIENVGIEPRGLAITNSGDDDDEVVYVTQFLSLPLPGKVDGADDAKAGYVTRISTNTDAVVDQIQLDPVADTGFKAAGDALRRIPIADPTVFPFPTGAYPNQLNNIAIKGDFAYVPNTGASPNGPVRLWRRDGRPRRNGGRRPGSLRSPPSSPRRTWQRSTPGSTRRAGSGPPCGSPRAGSHGKGGLVNRSYRSGIPRLKRGLGLQVP